MPMQIRIIHTYDNTAHCYSWRSHAADGIANQRSTQAALVASHSAHCIVQSHTTAWNIANRRAILHLQQPPPTASLVLLLLFGFSRSDPQLAPLYCFESSQLHLIPVCRSKYDLVSFLCCASVTTQTPSSALATLATSRCRSEAASFLTVRKTSCTLLPLRKRHLTPAGVFVVSLKVALGWLDEHLEILPGTMVAMLSLHCAWIRLFLSHATNAAKCNAPMHNQCSKKPNEIFVIATMQTHFDAINAIAKQT